MSRSNPEHRATPRPPVQRRPWPFPVTLPAPGHAPDPKPVKLPPLNPATMPDAPF